MSTHYSNAYYGGGDEASTIQWQAFVDSHPTQQHDWNRGPSAGTRRWVHRSFALVAFILAALTMVAGMQALIGAGVDVLGTALPLLALFLSGALCVLTIFMAVES